MKTKGKGILYFILIGFMFPMLFMIMLAFSLTWRFPEVLPSHLSLSAFNIIFNANSNILTGLGNSLLIAALVAGVAVPSAFIISRKIAQIKNKQFLILCAYLPFTLSPVIYAACLNYYFVLAGLNGTLLGVIIAQLIIVFPYNIVLFMSHWNSRMTAYGDLVATLGGSERHAFLKVIIPLSINILLLAFFQSFLISWFEFGLTNFIGIGQVQTLTIRVYQYISEANIQLAAMSSLLLVLPPLLLLWLNKRIVFHQV